MRCRPTLLASLTVALVAITAAPHPVAAADKETEKIEALIKHVSELEGAKFVRNGSEYDAATAARFLRAKWDRNKDAVKTAQDFIEKIATKSGTSGKPYLIRFMDGKESESGKYLTERLKTIR